MQNLNLDRQVNSSSEGSWFESFPFLVAVLAALLIVSFGHFYMEAKAEASLPPHCFVSTDKMIVCTHAKLNLWYKDDQLAVIEAGDDNGGFQIFILKPEVKLWNQLEIATFSPQGIEVDRRVIYEGS